MTASLPAVERGERVPWQRRPKIDQWICWWTIPVFYVIFGLIFVVLTRVMPPPRPDINQDQIVAFFADHAPTIRIGFALLMFFIGFTGVANGLIALQIKRMTVAPVFAYGYIAALVVGAVPGCLMAAFSFLAAAFRPERDPHIIAMLYDLALLSFVGSLGCFCTQNMVLALAIFLDRNGVLPKWLAYMSIWMIVTELLAGPVFIFTSGPLAWNGSISFYLGTVVFVVWQTSIIYLLFMTIKRQSPDEQIQD
ncbi:hypothetical protein [Mycolicibacterium mageritense]|uniref:DUF4386 domain-containing protein n=1 Tax=Mycolicibacterium mageritense TaxID=53462 RepID=A0AAI8U3C6_MYCME|nr:hypothetical protein [Mycolicibacterium mageritense]TXI57032.1 MAG: hypothetical protein E6Q55_27335 [Mycolicibacterium mageritense]BDY33276.1 hypothetical protein hbim_07253 [Mycolicibacterium mageritense]